MFEPWLTRWSLFTDGDPIITASSRLLPVLHNGQAAMLKITNVEEEKRGGGLMQWWGGDGAAKVLAREGDALLLERSDGAPLSALSFSGRDDEAIAIACRTAARLHVPRAAARPPLMPLHIWFAALEPAARKQGGFLARSLAAADELLGAPREVSVLHGDIHHDNILDFGGRGWLAIDPKGLIGERGFDFANLFCNPDMSNPGAAIAGKPEVFARRLAIISSGAGIERSRLLKWIIAYTGLSSAWLIEEGKSPRHGLAIGAQAEAALAA